MKSVFLFLMGLFLPCVVFCQGENNHWYFGYNAGMRFDTNPPTALTDGQMNTLESVASISDSSGNLLFYTDGVTVWNSQHSVMTNGTGLGGSHTTEQTIILPHPGDSQKYYIFTMCNASMGLSSNKTFASYSVVDMSLGAYGDVVSTQKNVRLKDEFGADLSSIFKTEAITSIMHNDGISYWVLIPVGNKLYSYRLNSTGFINVPIVSNLNFTLELHGHIKASPGLNFTPYYTNFISISRWESTETDPPFTKIYSFDNSTGTITPHYQLTLNYDVGNYSTEFNSDGTLLYGGRTEDGRLVVIDLLALNNREIYQIGRASCR